MRYDFHYYYCQVKDRALDRILNKYHKYDRRFRTSQLYVKKKKRSSLNL
jgi:hypothetical protein